MCFLSSSVTPQKTTHTSDCETTARYGNVLCNVTISHMLCLLYSAPQFLSHMTWRKPSREASFILLRKLQTVLHFILYYIVVSRTLFYFQCPLSSFNFFQVFSIDCRGSLQPEKMSKILDAQQNGQTHWLLHMRSNHAEPCQKSPCR